MTATLITNPLHHLTTLSDAMLGGQRRPLRTPSGYVLNVPLKKVRSMKPVKVEPYRTSSLPRAISRLLNDGRAVEVPATKTVLLFYSRRITRSMLYALGRLKSYHDRHPSEDFAHLHDFRGPSHGDWARLRWWGLIEPKPEEEKGRHRGWWRLTGLGHRWLRSDVKVPRSPAVFDGVFVGWMDAKDLIGPADVDPEFSLDAILRRKSA
jgi:hypothetical protein